MKSSIRNEIKAQIIRAGYTMQEVVDQLHDEYGWSLSLIHIFPKGNSVLLCLGCSEGIVFPFDRKNPKKPAVSWHTIFRRKV